MGGSLSNALDSQLINSLSWCAHLVQQTNHVLNEYTLFIFLCYVYLFAIRVKSWNCSVVVVVMLFCIHFDFAHNLFVNVLFARIRNT